MAIVLKKKPQQAPPVQSIAPGESSEDQQQVLSEMGLAPAKSGGITIKKKGVIEKGSRVRVKNGLWPFHQYYQKGDTGLVIKDYGVVSTLMSEPSRDRLFLVRMDKPRKEQDVHLSLWEVEAE